MAFKINGGLAGSADRIKQQQERAQNPRTYIRRVKDKEALRVRFLTEPEGWFQFREYYVQGIGYFPDANLSELGIELPADTRNPSKRYLANAYLPDESRVVPLLLPLDLASRIVMRFDRNGTITDRDFILHRAGSGIDTKYDAETDDKSSFDASSVTSVDLAMTLQRQFEDAFGLELDAVNEEETPESPSDVPSSAEKPSDIPSSAEKDDDGTLSEEDARKMDLADLELLAEQIGVERMGSESKDELIEKIFA